MNKPSKTLPSRLAPSFKVAGKAVETGGMPFVIAEAGSNFNQDLDTGYRLIDVAAEAGADAVKFQLFRPESLYPRGSKEFAAVSAVALNPKWVPKLAAHARKRKIAFMASAFDVESVDILDDAGVAAHKVASSEATNAPVLARIAASGKPVFLATGMCDMVDVSEAVAVCLGQGNDQVALMQCGAMYPLPPELARLRAMGLFRDIFGAPVGFSDHTLGLATPVAAVALGAAVIEKHFTLDRTAKGPDHFYALEPAELKQLVSMVHEAHAALGEAVKEMLPDERKFGRRDGLHASRDIRKGEKLDAGNIVARRPATGLRARYFGMITNGASAARAIRAGAPVGWSDIKL